MSTMRIVVLTGAGMSAESGISTFRDADGLWENHDIMEVASPQGWQKNPALVLDFYNQRRAQLHEVEPNKGHLALASLQDHFDVQIITQNVDDLHERAGSANVTHLHGELRKVRSTQNPTLIWEETGAINLGDLCPEGSQVRPHIVWFGEEVPMMEKAAAICATADVLIIIGTSMAVYPAASLVHFAPADAMKFLIDPKIPDFPAVPNMTLIEDTAAEAIPELAKSLRTKFITGKTDQSL